MKLFKYRDSEFRDLQNLQRCHIVKKLKNSRSKKEEKELPHIFLQTPIDFKYNISLWMLHKCLEIRIFCTETQSLDPDKSVKVSQL